MKLRSHLLVLTLATLVPMALFALGGAYVLAERERDVFRRGAVERARAMMTAIDAELRGQITTLQALGTSPAFDSGNMEALRAEAQRILPTQQGWVNIVVSGSSAEQLLNLRLPPGTTMAAPADPESLLRAMREGHPVIGDIAVGPAMGRPAFAIRVPVVRDGKVKYLLGAVIDPATIKALVDRQQFPQDWAVGIFDRKLEFVARAPEPPNAARFASPSLQQTLKVSRDGWNEGRTLEGTESFRAYTTSDFSGWAISIAIPRSVVTRAGNEAALLLAFGVLLAMAAGGFLALLLARRITSPIATLVEAAPRLGDGGAPAPLPDSKVDEVRDLTQALNDAAGAIREREARQKEAEDALRAADRAKDEFLAMLAHELRNPLATLTSAAELLKIGREQDGIVENAQSLISRQAAHMTHLVNDLLEVGRVTGGKIQLFPEPLDLAQAAARVLDTWAQAGRLVRHRVERALEPAWIMADPPRVDQIISNLLDNALKYTPPGGRIEVRVRPAPDNEALLEVADDGQGVPPELIGRMFDLFVQGERSLAREQGGLGIGLTLVKRLAEMHHGSAQASSGGPGKGATFSVTFPSIPAPAARASAAPEKPAVAVRRVLIVEDNTDARESMARLLRFVGHEVAEAGSGSEGLSRAAAASPEVALVDIGLPDISGYEVAKALRASPQGGRIHIIALTGYGKDEDRKRALAAGFDEHLTKPVEFSRLEQLLADIPPR